MTMSGAITQMSNQKFRLLLAPIYRYTLAAARREIVSPNYSTCGGDVRPCRAVRSGVRSQKFFQLHDSTLRTARADICLYVASDEGFECFSKVLARHDQLCKKTEVYQLLESYCLNSIGPLKSHYQPGEFNALKGCPAFTHPL